MTKTTKNIIILLIIISIFSAIFYFNLSEKSIFSEDDAYISFYEFDNPDLIQTLKEMNAAGWTSNWIDYTVYEDGQSPLFVCASGDNAAVRGFFSNLEAGWLIVPGSGLRYYSGSHCTIQNWNEHTFTAPFDFRGKDIKILAGGGRLYIGNIGINLDANKHLVEYKASTVNSNNGVILVDGNKYADVAIQSEDTLKVSISTGLAIDYIRYNILGCDIRNDEVIVFDDYTAGSTININNLKYTPIHFCQQETQFLIRDLVANSIVSDRGELLKQLVRGQNIVVPENKIYRVSYITKFVEGVTLRCEIGSALNTKTGKCEQVIFQKEPTEVILQCKIVDDCFIPKNCGDIVVSCKDNKCNYNTNTCAPEQVINEIIVYREILKEVQNNITETKFIGSNEFVFTHYASKSFYQYIGNYKFTAGVPGYKCVDIMSIKGVDQGKVSNPECYYVETNVGRIDNAQTASINSYIKVKYLFSGQGMYFVDNKIDSWKSESDWRSTYIFEVNPKGLFIQNYKIENQIISITLNNYIASFSDTESGFIIRTSYHLLQQVPVITDKKVALKSGINTYILELPSEQLGLVTVEIKPYIDIKSDTQNRIYGSDTILATYNVEKQNNINVVKKIQIEEENKILNILIWVVILIAVIIIGIILYKKFRK